MDHSVYLPEDYAAYDQIWQRVSPGSHPYGIISWDSKAPEDRGEAPPAPPSAPCRLGTDAAVPPLPPLFYREKQLHLLCAHILKSNRSRGELRPLRSVIECCGEAAQRLAGAWFLITGESLCHQPSYAPPVGQSPVPLRQRLRELYHHTVSLAADYRALAEQCTEPCIRSLLEELHEGACCRSEQLLNLTGQLLCR